MKNSSTKGCELRLFDILFAAVGLILLFPLFVFIVIILKFSAEKEVFFVQQRVGRFGENFGVIKFVTMLKNSPNIGSGSITSKNDPRILPFGKILRKTKINELPQLVNVLKGEMSIIGPRPHVQRDLQSVPKDILQEILQSRPGLSGIASIIFRDEEKILQRYEDPRPVYDELIAPYKAELELWYKSHNSLKLYFVLIYLTIYCIITGNQKNVFKIFPSLPKPNKKLKVLLNFHVNE